MSRTPASEGTLQTQPVPEVIAPIESVPASSTPASLPDLSPFREPEVGGFLRELEGLLSECRVAMLFGAGCSKCAGLPLMDELTSIVQKSLAPPSSDVLAAVITGFNGAPRCTIEDYMSEIVDHVAIAERRKLRDPSSSGVTIDGKVFTSETLGSALDDVKREIAKAIVSPSDNRTIAIHRALIRTLQGTFRAGRSSTFKHPIDYFTLNYDTLIEDALYLERIPTVDGFHGGATGWWDVDKYRDPSAEARVYKLHGSIDWCLCDDDVLPRRIRDGVAVPSRRDHLLIWPAATKYRETQRDPYAQLVSMMRKSLRPEDTEIVLCICGYAFSDEHINFELDRALRESNGRLTFVVFTSDNEPRGQLQRWTLDPQLAERVRIHANRGFFHSATRYTSPVDLPWWRFEVLTHLLSGHR